MQPFCCFKSDFVKAFGLHPDYYKLFFYPLIAIAEQKQVASINNIKFVSKSQ